MGRRHALRAPISLVELARYAALRPRRQTQSPLACRQFRGTGTRQLIRRPVSASWLQISHASVEFRRRDRLHGFFGVAPHELFGWRALLTLSGFVSVVVGGFLVGFATSYAGGCTSGHAIVERANFELPSLIAVLGFFAGGLAATYFILRFLIGGL
jgi:uncharacterized membrane protein YedE/YeeE